MARRLPERILLHEAIPLDYVTGSAVDPEDWIEGEPNDGIEPVAGDEFSCLLFLPQVSATAGETTSWRPRAITRPTLLYNLTRADGSRVALTKETRLVVTAADLVDVNGAETCTWQLDGPPQPYGPPGKVFGAQAILKRVTD